MERRRAKARRVIQALNGKTFTTTDEAVDLMERVLLRHEIETLNETEAL